MLKRDGGIRVTIVAGLRVGEEDERWICIVVVSRVGGEDEPWVWQKQIPQRYQSTKQAI